MLRLVLLFTLMSSAYAQNQLSPAEGKLMVTEGQRLWQNRDVKESLEEAISKFELAASALPEDLEIFTYLTKGYFFLGDVFTEDSGQKKVYLERAKNFGLQGLMTNAKFKKIHKKDGLQNAMKELTLRESPLLYWTAASLGKWAKANGIFSSLSHKGDLLAMISRVEELDPKFSYGAVPRYWGGFYAVAPSIAGGDIKKSKMKFQEALKSGPESLSTKVLYAELYLTKVEDKKEFKKVLEEVLKAGPGPEDIAPENRMEKKKAEKLLENIEEYF